MWDEVIPLLGDATVLALDVPGCGAKRGRDTTAVSVADIVAELIDDIETAGLSGVVLVGHSQAGTILPLMLAARPELFRRLVLVSCCAPLDGQSVLEMMGTSARGENPDEVGWLVPLAVDSPIERFRAMFCNDMSEADADAFLSKLGQDMWPRASIEHRDWRYDHLAAIPSSYILCEQDTSLPPEWQETFAARLLYDRIVRLNAGHQAMNTRPAELAALLLKEAE